MRVTGMVWNQSSMGRAIRRALVNPRGRNSFIELLPPAARVLDVGCGHDSPRAFKELRPDLHYVGIDVGDCRQPVDPRSVADEFVVVEPEDFRAGIERLGQRFDGVVSAHNLEHCYDQDGVVSTMCRVLVPGGKLFLAFPSAASLGFPSRAGCLNFRDDPTHNVVPDLARVQELLAEEGMQVDFVASQYRPPLKAALGLAIEPLSARRKKVMPGTWALYGFESVLWATKPV